MRVVHCFRSPVGGIFRHVRDLVHAQHAAGYEIGIICDSTTGGDYEARMFDALEPKVSLGIERTPMQRHVGTADITAWWRGFQIARRMRPDILHGHGAKGGLYSRSFGTLLRLGGHKVGRLYSPHGGSLHYSDTALSGRFFFLAERIMDRFTDHLIFVAAYEEAVFRQKIGAPHAPTSLIHNSLGPDEFEPVPAEAGAADFLYIGMMRDLKGPDLFIDAMARAIAIADRPLTAYMVGDGDDVPAYRDQAARLGLGEAITFLPAMPARLAFAKARTVVVPSRHEALPYIVLETLAAGKPLIATAVGGIPEIFAQASDVLVVPKAESIAAAMVSAAGDPEAFVARMPDPALFHRRFGIETMVEKIDSIYRGLMPTGGG